MEKSAAVFYVTKKGPSLREIIWCYSPPFVIPERDSVSKKQ